MTQTDCDSTTQTHCACADRAGEAELQSTRRQVLENDLAMTLFDSTPDMAMILNRERQIVDALANGPRDIESIVADLYADVDEKLHKAAAAVVYAHLLALSRAGRATTDGAAGGTADDPIWKADWRLV